MNDLERSITRSQYWLYLIGAFVLSSFIWAGFYAINPHCLEVTYCDEEFAMDGIMTLASLAFVVWLVYGRIVDIGCSRWWLLAALLPFSAIVFGLIPGENQNYVVGPSGEKIKPKSDTEADFYKMQQELDRPEQWP